MPLLVYSLLRLALFGACWWALAWAGLDPWLAVVAAALVAWGLSYVALRGPRDAAARWLAEQDARRKAGIPNLSARARQDAADEDALVEAPPDGRTPDEASTDEVPGEQPREPEPGEGDGQSASPRPSSTP